MVSEVTRVSSSDSSRELLPAHAHAGEEGALHRHTFHIETLADLVAVHVPQPEGMQWTAVKDIYVII